MNTLLAMAGVPRDHKGRYTASEMEEGSVGGLTRREFTLRASALAGALAAGSMLAGGARALTDDAAAGLDAQQIALLSALLDTLLQPESTSSGTAPSARPSLIHAGVQQLGQIYGTWESSMQQELAARLALTESGAPRGSFISLPRDDRQAFITQYVSPPSQTATLPPLVGLGQAAQLQAEVGSLLASLLSRPTDPSDLEPSDMEPTPDEPPPPPPFTANQALALAVQSAVDFGLLAFGPLPIADTEPDDTAPAD